MNCLPHRPTRILPPLRGRLAAEASPKLKQRFAEPVVRQLPSSISNTKGKNIKDKRRDVSYSDLVELKEEKSKITKVRLEEPIDQESSNTQLQLFEQIQPWQWLVGFLLLVILSICANRF